METEMSPTSLLISFQVLALDVAPPQRHKSKKIDNPDLTDKCHPSRELQPTHLDYK